LKCARAKNVTAQCGCIFAESVEEIISQLAILENLLSHFRKDVNRYPDSKAVEFSMKTVFEDYIEFCLIIVRNMAKSPIGTSLDPFRAICQTVR
jgi:hypothetical protein